jgi:hypothetical protein
LTASSMVCVRFLGIVQSFFVVKRTH